MSYYAGLFALWWALTEGHSMNKWGLHYYEELFFVLFFFPVACCCMYGCARVIMKVRWHIKTICWNVSCKYKNSYYITSLCMTGWHCWTRLFFHFLSFSKTTGKQPARRLLPSQGCCLCCCCSMTNEKEKKKKNTPSWKSTRRNEAFFFTWQKRTKAITKEERQRERRQ